MSNGRTWRVVLYAVVIFLAGAITGALVAPLIGRTFMRPPRASDISHHMMDRLRMDLNLTAAQMAQIRPLVEKTGADLEKIRRETFQRVVHRLDQTHAQIAALLTPAQQAKFKQLQAEHRKRLRHEHSLGGHPHGPPPDEPPPLPPDREKGE